MAEDTNISKERNDKKSAGFKTSIGGQALIEGIMMRGPAKYSVVVRSKDGLVEKTDDLHPLKEKCAIFGWPLIRGIVNFGSSMMLGMRCVMYSADYMPEEEQGEPSKFDAWIEKKLGSEKAEKIIISIAVVLGITFSVVLFMLLPALLAGIAGRFVENIVIRNLAEGIIRILIFLSYLWMTSKIKYISRMWAYHGAEHKAIYCFEKRLPLCVENVRNQSPLHPRCGTSFLFIVMIISILVFSLISWNNLLIRLLMRLALLPVVVAISYELIRLAGRYDNFFTRFISAPGKALQRFTTAEPDDEMIEVAIKALRNVIPEDEEKAIW